MPPEEKRQSRKEIKRGGGAPQCSHHCSGISPLHCDGQALPQVGEGLGFPGGLFETAYYLFTLHYHGKLQLVLYIYRAIKMAALEGDTVSERLKSSLLLFRRLSFEQNLIISMC